MQGREIDRVLRRDFWTNPVYEGVFPVDRLPSRHKMRGIGALYIINTDQAKGPGLHWTAVYFDYMKGRAEFWDSFGLHPTAYPPINRFIRTYSHLMLYNDLVLQSVTSDTCGQFCLFFALKKARGYSLPRIQSHFNPLTPWANDVKIRALIKREAY